MSARVLVVDDLLVNRKLLEARLSAEYFDVVLAASGPEALTICAADECDVVLLDVMMPGMDGFEVCRRLKQDVKTHHLPVIMVTALDQPSDRVRGLEAGADDFLTKPIDEIALTARVRSLARLKVIFDELRGRVKVSATLGTGDPHRRSDGRGHAARQDPAGRGPAKRRPAHQDRFSRHPHHRDRDRSAGGFGQGRHQRLRPLHHQPWPCRARRPAALLPTLLSRPHPAHPYPDDRGGGGPREAPARHGARRSRLSEAADRPQRTQGARPYADSAACATPTACATTSTPPFSSP